MKQKTIARLIAGILTGAVAIGVVQAGEIQSASTSLAREVIVDDTIAIAMPHVSYTFSGPINAVPGPVTFQVQFRLENGGRFAPDAAQPTAANIVKSIAIHDSLGRLQNQSATASANKDSLDALFTADYEVLAYGFNTTRDTIWATIRVHNAAASLTTPTISISTTSNVIGETDAEDVTIVNTTAFRPVVVGLQSAAAGNLVDDFEEFGICQDVKFSNVHFQHYTGLSSDVEMATAATAHPDEHTRPGTNWTRILTFPTNIVLDVKPTTGRAGIAAAGDVFTGSADATFVSNAMIRLGTINLNQNASGLDLDQQQVYSLAKLDGKATSAVKINGEVESAGLKVIVSASEGFAPGSVIRVTENPNCTAGIIGVSSAVAAGSELDDVEVVWPTTLSAMGTGTTVSALLTGGTTLPIVPLYVCYDATGATDVIPSSIFSAVAILQKATGTAAEQPNICRGPLYALSGGIKIDVRNYANSSLSGGWQSVIRLINTSETGTATVYGQIIHQDGTFGPKGQITTIPPRGVQNWSSVDIDAKLNQPNEAGAAGGVNQHLPYSQAQGAPRLRITAEGVNTLRVQNYLFDPTSGITQEVSGAQGVDFDLSSHRVPEGGEGQAVLQDARTGIDGRNF